MSSLIGTVLVEQILRKEKTKTEENKSVDSIGHFRYIKILTWCQGLGE